MTVMTLTEARNQALEGYRAAYVRYVDAVLAHRRRSRVWVACVVFNAAVVTMLYMRWHVHLAIVVGAIAGLWAVLEAISLALGYRALVRLRERLGSIQASFIELDKAR